jgi:hypothetical protein
MADMAETSSTLEGVPEAASFSVFQTEGSAGDLIAQYSDAEESIPVQMNVKPAQTFTRVESEEAICFKLRFVVSNLQGIGRLSKPIPIDLTVESTGQSLSCEELAVFASGANTQEVFEEFVTLFQEQYEHYTTLPEDRLSPRAAAIKRNFLAVLPPKK